MCFSRGDAATLNRHVNLTSNTMFERHRTSRLGLSRTGSLLSFQTHLVTAEHFAATSCYSVLPRFPLTNLLAWLDILSCLIIHKNLPMLRRVDTRPCVSRHCLRVTPPASLSGGELRAPLEQIYGSVMQMSQQPPPPSRGKLVFDFWHAFNASALVTGAH